jgi:glycosyltransferase involved in cell wall biosynthesis
MRITFVLPDVNMGGGTRVLAIHAQRLQQRGHRVVVVATPAPTPGFGGRLKSWLKGKPVAVEKKNRPTYFDGTGVDLRIMKSRRVWEDDVPPADVVIATWWETAEWVSQFGADKGAKAYFIQGYETYLPAAERIKATWALPGVQKIVVSRWLATIAQEQYGDENICIVPNSVDLDQFNSPVRGKQQIPTVGMLYAHVEIKRCDLMLKAYELARKQIPNLRLVAFGNVPVADHLPLPYGAGYWKSPPQDQIKQVYSQCDAWMFGSVQEGFGLPIVEAMACRTPVIATPAGAAPELLAGGGGVLVKDGDPKDMARAIVEICQMPETNWREVSEAAYKTASSFTWEDSSRLFEAALIRAVERQTGRQVQGDGVANVASERERDVIPQVVMEPMVAAPAAATVSAPACEPELQPVVTKVVEPVSAPVVDPAPVTEPIAEAPAASVTEAPTAPVAEPEPASVAAPVPEPVVAPESAAASAPPVAPVAPTAPAAPPLPKPKVTIPTSPIFAKPRVPLITAKPRTQPAKPAPELSPAPPRVSP